jgi:hypothetical protein
MKSLKGRETLSALRRPLNWVVPYTNFIEDIVHIA